MGPVYYQKLKHMVGGGAVVTRSTGLLPLRPNTRSGVMGRLLPYLAAH